MDYIKKSQTKRDAASPQYFNNHQTVLIKYDDKPKYALLNNTLINLHLNYIDTVRNIETIKAQMIQE